jgi:hypothetical protein
LTFYTLRFTRESMNWVFIAFVGAAVLHVLEEYVYPGGFADWMRRANPRFAPSITTLFAVVINGLFLVLCVIAAVVSSRNLILGLSVAALLFVNGCLHLGGTIRARRYAPGAASGVLFYIPLALYAFSFSLNSGLVSLKEAAFAGALGLLYNLVPIGYLGLSSLTRRS